MGDPPAVVLDELSDAELVAWYRQTLIAATLAPRLTRRRFRWRRAHSRAGRALTARLLAHAAVAAVCDLCHERRPTIHAISGEGTALRFHHYCPTCAPTTALGWFGVTEATRGSRPRSNEG